MASSQRGGDRILESWYDAPMSSRPTPKPFVLAVEDDPAVHKLYRLFFDMRHSKDFEWKLATNAEEGLAALRRRAPDVVLLDWVLPDMSGIELLELVRSHPKLAPIGVIVVTGKKESRDAVRALESGADDYVPKPFDLDVLLARIRSLLRRKTVLTVEPETVDGLGLSLNLQTGALRAGDKAIASLYPKEAELLRIFLKRPDVVHSPFFLWESVWGYEAQDWRHIVEAKISALRKRLGPKLGDRLKSRRGLGYFLESAP